jgi:hypothetical protein
LLLPAFNFFQLPTYISFRFLLLHSSTIIATYSLIKKPPSIIERWQFRPSPLSDREVTRSFVTSRSKLDSQVSILEAASITYRPYPYYRLFAILNYSLVCIVRALPFLLHLDSLAYYLHFRTLLSLWYFSFLLTQLISLRISSRSKFRSVKTKQEKLLQASVFSLFLSRMLTYFSSSLQFPTLCSSLTFLCLP